jgi:hypothetical protein
MTSVKSLFGVLALVAFGAAAEAADVTTMTCSDFMGMNTAGKTGAAMGMLSWINDTGNATAAGADLIAKYSITSNLGDWTPLNFIITIEGHCSDADPAMTVVERLRTHS